MNQHLQELVNRTLQIDTNTGKPSNDGGTTHFEHVMTFFALALQMNAKKILELGVRQGGSTYPLLVASKILGGNLTSVDINHPAFRINDPEFQKHWNFVRMDAIKFLEENSETFDLIYIDDWHSYSHVKRELELIDKISNENTIILLHDLMGMSHHPNYFNPMSHHPETEWGEGGPYRAVAELDLTKWEWMTLPVNHGLTLLRKKSKVETV